MRSIALFALAATAVSITLTACSSEPEVFSMTGTLTVPGGSMTARSMGRSAQDGDPCKPDDGYIDLAAGAPISVYAADGKLVATGTVGPGKYESFRRCKLALNVASVPGGPTDLYQVEVSNRGRTSVSGADAAAGKIALSVG